MEQSQINIEPAEILKQTSLAKLHEFIIDYAAGDAAFREAFTGRFNPQKSVESKKNYAAAVTNTFSANTLSSQSRYNQWDEYGFDADAVAADLRPLLDKADYFINHNNCDEAIRICCTLIEVIPDEWDPNFDYEGDVQVIYDEAIDKLQKMLEQIPLAAAQKKELFAWYSEEQKKDKHRHVGLNTCLQALEPFFMDTPEMLKQNLNNIDERIEKATTDYEKESAVLDKIKLLHNANEEAAAENVITQYLLFANVRKIRVQKLIEEKQYEHAIKLVQNGIKTAESKAHHGTVCDWKDKLLQIYLLQKNNAGIIAIAEDLFYNELDAMKYYHILKNQIEREKWAAYLDGLLARHENRSKFGSPDAILAQIFIEEQSWERLLQLVEKSGLSGLENYEEYLKPHFPDKLRDIFIQKIIEYAERNMGRRHYEYVSTLLKKLRKYPEGERAVTQLVADFTIRYKARRVMMEELREV